MGEVSRSHTAPALPCAKLAISTSGIHASFFPPVEAFDSRRFYCHVDVAARRRQTGLFDARTAALESWRRPITVSIPPLFQRNAATADFFAIFCPLYRDFPVDAPQDRIVIGFMPRSFRLSSLVACVFRVRSADARLRRHRSSPPAPIFATAIRIGPDSRLGHDYRR